MSTPDITGEICAMLRPLIPSGQRVDENTALTGDLGLSSLQVMELVERLEDRYDLSVPINVLADVQTVGDLGAAIRRLMNT